MTDKKQLQEMERALAEDWRSIKNLVENYEKADDQDIEEQLGELQVDMVLSDGETLSDVIE